MDNSTSTSSSIDGNESGLALDNACMDSWNAYSAMFESKQQHYELLQVLEDKKKKFNLSPTEADKQKLAELLKQHDSRVKQFTDLAQQLKNEHPESHQVLFKFIGQLVDGEPSKKVPH